MVILNRTFDSKRDAADDDASYGYFISKFKKPSVVVLFILRGVADCFWWNLIKADCMPIANFPVV